MKNSLKTGAALWFALVVIVFCGCGQTASNQWEIAVENLSDTPVDVAVTYGIQGSGFQSQGSASTSNLAKGKPVTLVVGPVKTVVHSFKVTQGKEVQESTPDVEIDVGKRYLIRIEVDGEARGGVISVR